MDSVTRMRWMRTKCVLVITEMIEATIPAVLSPQYEVAITPPGQSPLVCLSTTKILQLHHLGDIEAFRYGLCGLSLPDVTPRVALVPAVGLLLLYMTGIRQSGPETLGEPIHWNYARPYHAALLLMATGLSFVDSSYAGIALYMDTALAAAVVLTYHHSARPCIS